MSSGDTITAGDSVEAEGSTTLVGKDSAEFTFVGDAVFRAFAEGEGPTVVDDDVDDEHYGEKVWLAGVDGMHGFASHRSNGVVGFGGGFLNDSGAGNGLVGVGGPATSFLKGGNGVVGIGAAAGGVPGAGTIGLSDGEAPGAIGVCKAIWSNPQGPDAYPQRPVSVQIGVLGYSAETKGPGFGVYGTCDSPIGAGVSGRNRNGEGVSGYSDGGVGVAGRSGKRIGVLGVGPSTGYSTGVRGEGYFGVLGEASSPGGHGIVGVAPGKIGVGGNAGLFYGDVAVMGTLTVNGAKCAAVRVADGSHRRLYSVESPESWFEDFGEVLLKKGRAVVKIPKDFMGVIGKGPYHVFLTAYGDCNGLYAKRSPSSFEVRELQGGKSSLQVSYRITAKRRDIEGKRLEKVTVPKPAPKPGDSSAPLAAIPPKTLAGVLRGVAAVNSRYSKTPSRRKSKPARSV